MICKACNKTAYNNEMEDCFENALNVLKKHYTYYKNTLQQRDLELQQVKERNEKLKKALFLLQKAEQPAKRFKSQRNFSREDCIGSDLSLIEDEPMGASNLNIALNSEQLFETSSLSQTNNDVSITSSSSEMIQSPRIKESPKRNRKGDSMRYFKDRSNKYLQKSKSEWHTKERNSPTEKSWAMKFVQPAKVMTSEEKIGGDEKNTADKKLYLSLKKPNPSKIKQSLINFNKTKESTLRESNLGDDIIDASPVVVNKNTTAGRSWAHRSVLNQNISSTTVLTEVLTKKDDDTDKTLDDIVFDFSPTKKTDSTLDPNPPKNMEPKKLKFEDDMSTDCISLHNEHLGFSTAKSDSSSVVILTPASQDIIFIDDNSILEHEIDTMDLLADMMKQGSTDNLEKLKEYESKCMQKQNKDLNVFKKPENKIELNTLNKIKKENISQENSLAQIKLKEANEEKPICSKIKHQNPLFSSDLHDPEEDEGFMPKPFKIKQELDDSKSTNKFSIKQRFNIDCEDCEKLVNFLDKGLTDDQIQIHLDKCKRHNNPEMMRQNTPEGYWNPFILSFQPDDPRNEVLIDNRFKDNSK